ncbi:RES family NAD+ phosphorylase [Paludisphaera sp.]|uniref:RES family NAD+ phosphorylase n=1 Tax=Paludisphaera sp. TaxID=2017432 RepID=UPI00301E148E
MLDRPSLDAELRALADEGAAVDVDAFVFRSIALRHFMPPRKPSPLYCSGSIGSRFAPDGHAFRCLYAALDAETAHREGNQAFYAVRSLGVRPADLKPPDEVVMIGVRFSLRRVLDLGDPSVRDRLGTSAAELAGRWKLVPDAPTQRLGAAVHDSRAFDGLAYPSVQNPGAVCLVVFPDTLAKESFIDFRSRTPGVPNVRMRMGPPTAG